MNEEEKKERLLEDAQGIAGDWKQMLTDMKQLSLDMDKFFADLLGYLKQ